MRVRPALTTDAVAMHDLHARSVRWFWPSSYAVEQVEGWIAGRTPEGYVPGIERGEMFVAELGNAVVGFGHAKPGSVEAIFVAPEHAGCGVGRALLRYALREAGRSHDGPIGLISTLNATGFYERFGFERVREEEVSKGTTALRVIVMRRRVAQHGRPRPPGPPATADG